MKYFRIFRLEIFNNMTAMDLSYTSSYEMGCGCIMLCLGPIGFTWLSNRCR
jgi:hypothetical protein